MREGELAGFALEVAFPELRCERPVFLCPAAGDPAALWVVEQGGRIWRVPAPPASGPATLACDLSARVSRRGNEEGLLGLAWTARDPRWVYVYYSALQGEGWVGGRSRLARLPCDAAGAIDAAREEVLLEVEQPYSNHNGGMLCFGPDGLLYLGLGDGGLAGDPHAHGQNRASLLGAILRLDPSRRGPSGEPYAIPADNPFVGDPVARGELWAFGLRNPWRFSFAPDGGLWVGDVGQNAWEEVHRVRRGDNCGWRRFEGFTLYDEDQSAPAAVPPLLAYGRSEGASITGGYVYRGQAHPALVGRYLFADFVRGNVWAATLDPAAPAVGEGALRTAAGIRVDKLLASGQQIASFGEDAAGELYLCCFDGRIRRLVRAAQASPQAR